MDHQSILPGMDHEPAETTQWPTLKDYEILAELGKGGMGTVYKARHTRLDRVVALKIIRVNFLASDDAEVLQRFEREARAAAQLRHPNIVLIYDFNQHDDIYYISMEYVQGQSLHQIVEADGPLPVDVACDYIRQTALGLQHAFENGMVHRDIKPPNLLLQPPRSGVAGEAQSSNGTIKILDMGLVYFPGSTPNENSQLTVVGTVIGTPDYIAPEQTLDSHCVDIRADIYSLGCTFYYLLAGKPPFGEFRLMQKLMMHQTKEPKPIDQVRPEVPAHVAEVVHRLCAKKPEDRYQTPWEVANALAPPSPPTTSLPAHTPIPGLLLPPGSLQPPPSAPSVPDSSSSIHASQHPISMFDTMNRLPTGGSGGSTIIKLNTPIPDSAQIAAIRAQKEEPTGPPPPQQFAVLKRHNGWVTTLSFSPSRRTLASGGVDCALKLWDLGSNPQDISINDAHKSDITRLAYAPDSEYLATGSGGLDGLIRLWHCNGTSARPAQQIPLGMTGVDALRFSPEGRLLAAGGSDHSIRLWDVHLATPKLLATLKGHQSDIKELAFLPDGNILVSGCRDGSVRVWNLAKFWSKEQAVLDGLWGQIHALGISPQGDLLAFGALDQKVYLWEMTDSKPRLVRVLEGHTGVVRITHFNPDGETLLSVCDRGQCILWDLANGTRRREWQLVSGSRNSMAVTFDGRYLATGNSDGTISLFRFYPRRDRDS